ncbi:MAG: cytochrome c [Gammaproteobacteria bacterium]
MKKLLLVSLVLGFMLIATHADAGGDANAGQEKSQVCSACHGADGNSPLPEFPILAGQHESYLVEALYQYRAAAKNEERTGKRSNAIMMGMAAGLSDEDIADLAAYYAGQDGPLGKIPMPE